MNIKQEILSCIAEAPKYDGQTLTATLRMPPEASFFDGHFPDRKILPGIAQIEITRVLLEQQMSLILDLKEASSLKFYAPVGPESAINVKIICTEDKAAGNVTVKSLFTFAAPEEGKISEIKAVFEERR